MMPPLERATVVVAALVVVSACSFNVGKAQAADRSDIYKPNGALQSPPLRVEVIDGTRFRDLETHMRYRLYGIATCVPGQIANLGRQAWPCGTMATAWLVSATLNRWVSCTTLRQVDGVNLARCASADHADIAGDMVHEGIALTLPPTNDVPSIRAYVAAEREARKAYRGLWASSFQMPWLHGDSKPSGSIPTIASRDK
ncbi:Endonuclease YncB, thermonuclease family (plasmid) [Beijerinckiaceae bacterium RH AL1]|nr:Endonuclease YncB, thermonuclease family [Beijerinckiaceae bacterium RH CH11]VVB50337.1 Endonuclease YncB, thermonuclease family [Beijerinckiaceae bacterium RH AL8]VVC57353.1 Endonuclease YncB, thermonuclease family [Beijerinckiaceae bacterium RH AL1]